ncbi:hypothetical protein G7Z17_g3236 [Cylindrodendrum hubeiense]|uniref:Uncharacterized protein n=1 Tax=Cylindrodendrum hubeiense TaxID=595255 RepID=A0A9P5HHB3_9HYPO|nr:hypothetical protein G7Z17_g3236 [Cylindrodendrum hubeiense]
MPPHPGLAGDATWSPVIVDIIAHGGSASRHAAEDLPAAAMRVVSRSRSRSPTLAQGLSLAPRTSLPCTADQQSALFRFQHSAPSTSNRLHKRSVSASKQPVSPPTSLPQASPSTLLRSSPLSPQRRADFWLC